MKTLLIIVNPSKTSYTHALAEAYKTWAEKRGDNATLLDLYDLDQDILQYERRMNWENEIVMDEKQC
jgi:putative NADPH-quinone reductase